MGPATVGSRTTITTLEYCGQQNTLLYCPLCYYFAFLDKNEDGVLSHADRSAETISIGSYGLSAESDCGRHPPK